MYKYNRRSLLSSTARIQVPWVKVTFKGSDASEYTFGVFSSSTKKRYKTSDGFYHMEEFGVKYPNYVQSLQITKINGQVNQYVLSIKYPITQNDDPNFFEKVFSSVSKTRKIVFSYGDAATPSFVYKDEEAVITTISQSFDLSSSAISYTINAVSGAALNTSACISFPAARAKPSSKIKEVFYNYRLNEVFTGMNEKNWNKLVDGTDMVVDLEAKTNISALDYITYLVSCMYPATNSSKINPKSIYVLTIHDDSSYDSLYAYNSAFGESWGTDNANEQFEVGGPYFKVSRVSYADEKSDAYEIDIGYNTSAIVTSFSLENNENYSLYYDYQMSLAKEIANDEYVRRINTTTGEWDEIYSPAVSSKNEEYLTRASDRT